MTMSRWAGILVLSGLSAAAAAQPSSVEHTPASPAFSESPGITQREPEVPRESETVDLYFRVSFQFTYDVVAVYYTTDGTDPSGSFGTPAGSTQVLTNQNGGITFRWNENSGGTRDWWRATLPSSARQYAQNIKYKISAWKPFVGGEVFANAGTSFTFTNKLAWPGAGAGNASPDSGYPPVSFWKEEAVFGNTFTAGMIDQNGAVYDMHFPTPGGIYGVGTRNEGYVDGPDTFPPLLPPGWRGQMHLNQAMPGIRVDGLTHWLSNPNAVSYSNVSQSYNPTSNTVITTQTLPTDSGAGSIAVQQYDFSPLGVTFPTAAGQPIRHIYIKRMRLTYSGPASKAVNVYWYIDPALNGGDGYDAMFFDSSRGVMCAFDKTTRTVTGTGNSFSSPNEYNPTTDSGYLKNVALYLGVGMKTASSGQFTSESWRDTSADQGQGWIGQRITLTPGITTEVDFYMVGGHFRPNPMTDPMPVADGVYDNQIAPAIDWLNAQDIASLMTQTDTYWSNWLSSGVRIDSPDGSYDSLFDRGLLATALHLDGVNGGVIAGFHNGAYPYVWPRDAVYAAVTLARTGHLTEAAKVYDWMRNTTFRTYEPGFNRFGFWKQKYSTDGYVIWGAPQIDETAVFPWGVYYQYLMTADNSLLSYHLEQVRDAVAAMTNDSIDSRLRYEEAFDLVYSNNVWEDSYDTFIYSNANVVRGLWDASSIFSVLGLAGESSAALAKGNTIRAGLNARLDWNGENTDISALGIVYPFNVLAANDPRAALVVDRINGVALDRFGNNHPLVNFSGEHQGTINRYWGDGYWNGGPWFLSTVWYGLYYADRADLTMGKGDIDNHKSRMDLCIDRLGPAGFGAEQIAYSNSYMYPGQSDFTLQTAWPNAWESMSTFVDGVMAFIDFSPNAPQNTFSISPKLPTGWSSLTARNLTLVNTPAGQTHKVDALVEEVGRHSRVTFTNLTGHALTATVTLKVPETACSQFIVATVNQNPVAYSYSAPGASVTIPAAPIDPGASAVTIVDVFAQTSDFNADEFPDAIDYDEFINAWLQGDPAADINDDGFPDAIDYDLFISMWLVGC